MVHRIQIESQRFKLLVAAAVICAVPIFAPVTNAQEKPKAQAAGSTAQHTQNQTGKTPSKEEEEGFPELEAVASDVLQNVNLVVPLFRGLNIEGHYYGIRVEPEREERGENGVELRSRIVDSGTINGSWNFRLGEHVVLTPGFGVYFGENQKTSPAVTFRWEIEKGRIVSQGLFIQSLIGLEGFDPPSIWDGNHVSARFWRMEVGPSWEFIHTREENEWKGGGRAAFRILPNLSVVLFVLAPETEFRGGIIIHPAR
ncbi:MAG: hypothetical protein MOB07_02590 [Acidobacteria bacterium]|nr:hypothetical protein [Acidobacteriota bacterium]